MTDTELIEKLGVPENHARQVIRMLDKQPTSGFPKKAKLWGSRRYWPAVAAWFDAMYGLPSHVTPATDARSSRNTFAEGPFRRGEDPFDLKNYKSIFDK